MLGPQISYLSSRSLPNFQVGLWRNRGPNFLNNNFLIPSELYIIVMKQLQNLDCKPKIAMNFAILGLQLCGTFLKLALELELKLEWLEEVPKTLGRLVYFAEKL